MKKLSALVFLLVMLPVCLQAAEPVTVTSSFDKRSVHVNEEINLTIRISGAQGNIQAPRLPAFKGFDTFYTGRSSNITFVNNVFTSTLEFSYVLIPKAAGKYVFDPIEVYVSSQAYRTAPVEIEVLADQGQMVRQTQQAPLQGGPAQRQQQPYQPPPASAPVPQEPPPSFRPDDDNIFVKAWLDKTTAYPNEQVLLTYSLYTRYDTRYEGFEKEPEISGFWIEEFPMDREIARETVRMNGKRYVKADVKKVALFPTTAATYTIQPGTLKVSVREEPQNSTLMDEFFNDSFFSGGGFFARRENRVLKPPAVELTVKPFPEQGKPASFQGSVGNFRLTATLDKQSVKQNEPVTMKIVLEGEGNIETLNKPAIPDLPKFKTYDANTSSDLYKSGLVIGGRKTFEIVFIPLESGTLTIPSLEFSFFNPASAQYRRLQTSEFSLDVKPSDKKFQLPAALSRQEEFKKDIKMEGRDIRYIHERLPSNSFERAHRWLFPGLMAANALLTILMLAGLMRERTHRIFSKDTALKRKKLARTQAEGRLRRLQQLLRSKDSKSSRAFFEEIEKVMTVYLSDKFNFSAHGITRLEIENHLAGTLGPEDPLHRSVLEIYRLCDEARFGRGDVQDERKAEAFKVLQQMIQRVEKMRH